MSVVSGNLWRELRSARQSIVYLQEQLNEAKVAVVQPVQVYTPQLPRIEAPAVSAPPPPAVEAPAAPIVITRVPDPRLLMIPLPVPGAPATPAPVVTASVRTPLIGGSAEERRANALIQSDGTAMARVQAWNTRLRLSAEQLQALNTVAMAELRVETEESLDIDSRILGVMDAAETARLNEETIQRQHATNLRILEKMTPQMTPEQSDSMRVMFEAWVAPRLAAASAAREAAARSGN